MKLLLCLGKGGPHFYKSQVKWGHFFKSVLCKVNALDIRGNLPNFTMDDYKKTMLLQRFNLNLTVCQDDTISVNDVYKARQTLEGHYDQKLQR